MYWKHTCFEVTIWAVLKRTWLHGVSTEEGFLCSCRKWRRAFQDVQAMPLPCSYHLGWDQSLASIMILCMFLDFRERIQVFLSRMCNVRKWCYILPQLTYWHQKDWYSDGAPCPWSQWNMSLSTVNLITFIGNAVPVGTVTHKLSCTCERKLKIFLSRSRLNVVPG